MVVPCACIATVRKLCGMQRRSGLRIILQIAASRAVRKLSNFNQVSDGPAMEYVVHVSHCVDATHLVATSLTTTYIRGQMDFQHQETTGLSVVFGNISQTRIMLNDGFRVQVSFVKLLPHLL